MATPSMSQANPYRGHMSVEFHETEQGLEAKLTTDRLEGHYVVEDDIGAVCELFNDPEVMAKFGNGEPRTFERTRHRCQSSWIPRHRTEKNPYTAVAFYLKNTPEFVTLAVAGGGDAPGESELAYLTQKKHWQKGFTKEGTTVLVHGLLPVIRGSHKVGGEDGEHLSAVVASARPNNLGSVRICIDLGMEIEKVESREPYGGDLRYHFRIEADRLGEI